MPARSPERPRVRSCPVNTSTSSPLTRARVTLAHDYLLVLRGAERTFAAMADMYPHAPIFTLLYDQDGTLGRFADHPVTASSLQRLGVRQSRFRRLLPLYPWAVQRLALAPCDVVLSSSSAFAHGVRKPAGAIHICYCHTPFRYVWYEQQRALSEVAAPARPLLRAELARIRRWDLQASRGVDVYVANSQLTRERIGRYYGRDAHVIHPPIDTRRFSPGEPGEALLVVAELVPHKRVQVALEAARRARVPIRVVGSGPEHAALRRAHPEADFVGRAEHDRLVELYASARAVVVPSPEEFGMVAVEAQAAGRPVVAAAYGGALETVLDGKTGLLATLDDVGAFARAIEQLSELEFDPAQAVANAQRFSVEVFQQRVAELVSSVSDDREELRAARR
jgi:glycosyltransferase involved in cell wall biosynthesis